MIICLYHTRYYIIMFKDHKENLQIVMTGIILWNNLSIYVI
jgi:hypothetical protein